MKTPITLLFLLFCYGVQSQIIFKEKTDEIYIGKNESTISEKYTFSTSSLPHNGEQKTTIIVEAEATSSLDTSYFDITSSEKNHDGTNYTFHINVHGIPDTLLNEAFEKDIKLKVSIKKENNIIYQNSNFYSVKVTNKRALSDYRYLAYVGTNFDLVDGIQAKNLFFATNIFLKPVKNLGFNISLYGNRAISRIDSVLDQERPSRVFDSLDNVYLENRRMDIVRNFQTDNLGANFSVLSKLFSIDAETDFYYSGQLEFIYRRIRLDIRYSNFRTLDPILQQPGTEIVSYEMPSRELSQFSIYDFNIGVLGFLITHENQIMSIRLFMNTGFSETYLPKNASGGFANIGLGDSPVGQSDYIKQGNMFYSGKLWITERTSGVTLQAEVNNTLNRSNPFYGVTLSKAFDFEKIGSIFSPLSSRSK
jgi:hypothetical protein